MSRFKWLSSICLLMVLIFIGVTNAFALGHYGIPGTMEGCNVCHDFENGYYNNPSLGNLRWVKSSIEWPPGNIHEPVKFTTFSSTLPADGTLADGDDTKLDGPCEVCHTQTNYHTNTGDGTTHFDAQNCTACHPHFRDDIINYFEPHFTGTQSHITHWTDPKGPQLGENNCTVCHYPYDYSKFGPNGDSFEDTDVCDACHSPDGAFDGVAEAKAKWEEGVYEPNGYELKPGNENWCATCHDDGTSIVNGVQAPNVMGDNTTYGYNISGHGFYNVRCDDCHDLSTTHTDGEPRTYLASIGNYREGYRLNDDMAVPRNGETQPAAFRLCLNCHVYTDITGSTSNFRDDLKEMQFHEMHLEWWPAFICSDSDFDGMEDSAITCTICHNVHGSPTPVMVRHGELISTPGTTDKVPALDFHWYKADATTPTTVLEESRYGGLLCGLSPDISYNHVCFGCHATGELKWYRTPGGPLGVIVEAVWTSDLNDVSKTEFAVGEDIRYHVRFRIIGSGSYFVKSPKNKSKAFNTSGADWVTKLPKKDTLPPGTYEWSWDEKIPNNATPGSSAKVKIVIKVYDAPGGTLLSTDKKSSAFSIAP